MALQSKVDKWFMRCKDAIIIFGVVGTIIFGAYKYYKLPEAVASNSAELASHETQIRALQASVEKINSRFETVDLKQDYTNKSIDEMKTWLKTIATRIR